jgi:hypothetical protein
VAVPGLDALVAPHLGTSRFPSISVNEQVPSSKSHMGLWRFPSIYLTNLKWPHERSRRVHRPTRNSGRGPQITARGHVGSSNSRYGTVYSTDLGKKIGNISGLVALHTSSVAARSRGAPASGRSITSVCPNNSKLCWNPALASSSCYLLASSSLSLQLPPFNRLENN